MGCAPSRYERDQYGRYVIYDDRDDFDDCCGCGPWYGGEYYREARRRYLPGYGSPPGNYFGWGGYAGRGMYPPIAETDILASQMAVVPSQVGVVPYQSQVGVVPYQSQVGVVPYQSQVAAVPLQSQIAAVPCQPQLAPSGGYIASSGWNGGYPYRRSGMW